MQIYSRIARILYQTVLQLLLPFVPTKEVSWFGFIVVADAADEDKNSSDEDNDSSRSSYSSSTESNESGEEDKSQESDYENSEDDDSDNGESSSDEDFTPPSGPINLIMGGLPIRPQSRW